MAKANLPGIDNALTGIDDIMKIGPPQGWVPGLLGAAGLGKAIPVTLSDSHTVLSALGVDES